MAGRTTDVWTTRVWVAHLSLCVCVLHDDSEYYLLPLPPSWVLALLNEDERISYAPYLMKGVLVPYLGELISQGLPCLRVFNNICVAHEYSSERRRDLET